MTEINVHKCLTVKMCPMRFSGKWDNKKLKFRKGVIYSLKAIALTVSNFKKICDVSCLPIDNDWPTSTYNVGFKFALLFFLMHHREFIMFFCVHKDRLEPKLFHNCQILTGFSETFLI